jgi:hypothetical protein
MFKRDTKYEIVKDGLTAFSVVVAPGRGIWLHSQDYSFLPEKASDWAPFVAGLIVAILDWTIFRFAFLRFICFAWRGLQSFYWIVIKKDKYNSKNFAGKWYTVHWEVINNKPSGYFRTGVVTVKQHIDTLEFTGGINYELQDNMGNMLEPSTNWNNAEYMFYILDNKSIDGVFDARRTTSVVQNAIKCDGLHHLDYCEVFGSPALSGEFHNALNSTTIGTKPVYGNMVLFREEETLNNFVNSGNLNPRGYIPIKTEPLKTRKRCRKR